MNLDSALESHAEWKARFRKAIDGREHLDVPKISKDNLCALGQWMHGPEGRKHSRQQAYQALITAHKKFHRSAARIAGMINAGEFDHAEAALQDGSPYSADSDAVCDAIRALQDAMARQ